MLTRSKLPILNSARRITRKMTSNSFADSAATQEDPYAHHRKAIAEPKLDRLTVRGPIECPLYGFQLLNSSLFNKGTAFTDEERAAFGLQGFLPPQINTLDEQLERAYKQLSYLKTAIAKNDFMTNLRVTNKTLYFALIKMHIMELVPIVYTPTEGDAIASYSDRFRKAEGVFLDITDPQSVRERLKAYGGEPKDVDYVVVSDSEAILGIGDQGVGGVRISLAKMALMTVCGGIHPGRVLPVCLDVGTDNKNLARDELYLGNRFSRTRGRQYDQFVESFVEAVTDLYPHAVVHFEDFGKVNATRLLDFYRDKICCFNDDVQGTGAVVTASLLAALKHTNRDLKDIKVVIYGAGTAGIGVADQIVNHMVNRGMTYEDACSRIFAMDSRGVIMESMREASRPEQRPYCQPDGDWEGINSKSLLEVVRHVKPTCLVGCSTRPGSFTKEIVQEMWKHNPRPIIFPLSNPTRLHEAVPEDLMNWTDNQALVTTGSPFPPVNGYTISQNNNCYCFPGIGLGAVLSRARLISTKMISAAVDQLASLSELRDGDSTPGLLPGLERIHTTSARIAAAVILQAIDEGLARVESMPDPKNPEENMKVPRDFDECVKWVEEQMWDPVYRPMVRVKYDPKIHTNQI